MNAKTLFLHFFWLIPLHDISQNLVPNPSFEEYYNCPTQAGQIGDTSICRHWLRVALSPDYFNACDTTSTPGPSAGVPLNGVGSQMAHSGSAYAGFYAFNGWINPGFPPPYDVPPNGREYMQVTLLDSLRAGKKYHVEMHISLSDFSEYAVSALGVYLSDTLLPDANLTIDYIEKPAQVQGKWGQQYTSKLNWMRLADTITAIGGEQFLAIGNFVNDSLSDTLNVDNGNRYYFTSYYYIDDVLVIDVDSLADYLSGVEEVKQQMGVKIYPNPANDFITIETEQPGVLTVFNLLGQLAFQSEIRSSKSEISCAHWPPGIYSYIFTSSNDKTTRYGKIVKR